MRKDERGEMGPEDLAYDHCQTQPREKEEKECNTGTTTGIEIGIGGRP